jgi:hypothetical protein
MTATVDSTAFGAPLAGGDGAVRAMMMTKIITPTHERGERA